jgi:Rho-binding antiterminator
MNDDKDIYTPIDCGDYSRYEVAIMHREKLQLTWRDNDGLEHIDTIMPEDLQTRHHKEYLIAKSSDGKKLQIRLDRIHRISSNK